MIKVLFEIVFCLRFSFALAHKQLKQGVCKVNQGDCNPKQRQKCKKFEFSECFPEQTLTKLSQVYIVFCQMNHFLFFHQQFHCIGRRTCHMSAVNCDKKTIAFRVGGIS